MLRELLRVVVNKWMDPKDFQPGKYLGLDLADVVLKQNDRARAAGATLQTRRPCQQCGYESLQLTNGKCRRCEVGGALASEDRGEETL